MIATVAPASAAASAARWPARPAPMIRTSCAGMAASLVRDNDAAASGRMRCIRAYSVAVMAPVRVLLIDDHADVRYLIRTLVGDAPNDVEVVAEADGWEAADAALDDAAPDVVVMDARMPVVDGFEASRRLLERRPDLPIVLCSGLVDDDVRRRADEAGIRAVLSKDEFDDIASVVE